MSKKPGLALLLCLATVVSSNPASADSPRSRWISWNNAPHYGQLDTDGILSPGERPNPRIDYDRVQRRAEWRGDYRVDNRYNYLAAAESREAKDRWRARYNWGHDWDYHDDYDCDHHPHNSWWRW